MKPHIITIGNEKGGGGKTTTAMHLIISLLKIGFAIGSIDLDLRQGSLSQYIENRKKTAKNLNLAISEHIILKPAYGDSVVSNNNNEQKMLDNAINQLAHNDFIIIDTPGSNTYLGRAAHFIANSIITPINDSFVDLDVIGKIDVAKNNYISPGIYSAMLWEQKIKKAANKNEEVSWIVVRNRLSTLNAYNKMNVGKTLDMLSKKFGFTVAAGFGDRVIFKELFIHGLTLHDAKVTKLVRMSASMLAARNELVSFMKSLNIKAINEHL